MNETARLSVGELVLGHDYHAGMAYWASFLAAVVSRGFPHERFACWDTTAPNLDELLEYATHSSRLSWGTALLLDLEAEAGCHAVVRLSSGAASVHLAAESVAALAAGEAFLRERLPERVATDDQTVPIAFWSYGPHGPTELSRSIEVPSWDEIRANYPARVRAELEPLMNPAFRPDGRGQLLLWYGEPGTGKTYGLRALAWQWRTWCTFHYVTDPEALFGRPGYMLYVVLGQDYDEDEGDDDNAWKLLILEDTGELLAADAKMQTGQGLSRLLNLVDGIIGQGLRIMVLVTTNDELSRLHPAVSRPGRCLAKVEFESFGESEAQEWLERNGVDQDGGGGTLASLFGVAAGESVPERLPVGFGR